MSGEDLDLVTSTDEAVSKHYDDGARVYFLRWEIKGAAVFLHF